MVTRSNTMEQLKAFWAEVADVWHNGFLGIDIGSIVLALCIFGAFLVLRGFFTKYILYVIRAWTQKSQTDIDDKVIDALIPPIRFIPVVLGFFFAVQVLNPEGIAEVFFSRCVKSMIAFAIFWGLHRALAPIRRLSRQLEKMLTKMMMDWIFKALKVAVVFIGGAVIFEIWGIAIGPLLAGLGLFGAAIALGAQDLFKNLIGGLTVIAEKRFNPGDWIQVDGVVEGVVEDIGFRSTLIRRFDKAPVYVPNSALSDAVVTNFTRMFARRIYWKIGVTYSTTKEQLIIVRDEIMKYIEATDEFDKAERLPTYVRLDSFNNSSIDLVVCCYTKSIEVLGYMQVKEELALAIKDIVEEKAGTGFAFPSQSLYIETVPGDLPELFKAPEGGEKPKKKSA